MPASRPDPRASPGVSLPTALLTWAPIAIGLILGAILRLVLLIFGAGFLLAGLASVLCAGVGAGAAVLWLRSSGESIRGRGILQLSATWVLLTMGFRATCVGLLLGAGWQGVVLDYRLLAGQPLVVVLLIVAVAPLTIGWGRRDPPVVLGQAPPDTQ